MNNQAQCNRIMQLRTALWEAIDSQNPGGELLSATEALAALQEVQKTLVEHMLKCEPPNSVKRTASAIVTEYMHRPNREVLSGSMPLSELPALAAVPLKYLKKGKHS